jgi:hypothetical protein
MKPPTPSNRDMHVAFIIKRLVSNPSCPSLVVSYIFHLLIPYANFRISQYMCPHAFKSHPTPF